MPEFTLLVGEQGDNNVKLLTYFRNNIDTVNDMGVYLQIKVLTDDDMDPEMVATLESRNIPRLPALVIDGKPHIGYAAIRKVFDKNITRFKQESVVPGRQTRGGGKAQKPAVPPPSYGTSDSPELASYFEREMFSSDQEKESGDGFGGGASSEDLNRRMRDAMSSRKIDARAPGGPTFGGGDPNSAGTTPPPQQPSRGARVDTPNLAPSRMGNAPPREDYDPRDAMFDSRFTEGLNYD